MHTACWDGAACVVSCSGGRALSAAPPFRERARGPHSPRLSSRAAALHARHAADTSGALMSVHEQGGTLLGERCAGAACDSLVNTCNGNPGTAARELSAPCQDSWALCAWAGSKRESSRCGSVAGGKGLGREGANGAYGPMFCWWMLMSVPQASEASASKLWRVI